MSKAILFVGNVGMGKSLIARKLAKKGYVIINMDSIQSMIGGGEYGLYDVNKKGVYTNMERSAIETALQDGLDIVIDRTNVDKARRGRYINLISQYTNDIECYHFGVGDIETCIKRRMKSPREVSQKTWEGVYKKMESSYEVPTLDEGFSSIIEMPSKYEVHAFDFDGTIVENKYPKFGAVYDKTKNKMMRLSEDLNNIIVIWTCRDGETRYQMKEFLVEHSIPFDTINENPIFETGSRKIYADKYYDDRNVLI